MGSCLGKSSKNKEEKKKPNFGYENSDPYYVSQEREGYQGQQAPPGFYVPPNNKKFAKDALEAHNRYREMHSASKLHLNSDLCQIAQSWAERIARSNTFEHSQNMYANQPLGENIAMRFTSTGDELTGKQMTDQWYEEAHNYNYGDDFQQGKGHFAQIVWRKSREVGFGRARSEDGKWYAVANYFPAGNYIGHFRENVSPPRLDRL